MSASAQNTPKNGTQTVKTPTDGGNERHDGKGPENAKHGL